MSNSTRILWQRYGFAVLAVLLGLALNLVLKAIFGMTSGVFLILLVPVTCSALYGGLEGGLFATFLSVLAVVLLPASVLSVVGDDKNFQLILFILQSFLTTGIIVKLQKGQQRNQVNFEQLQIREQELKLAREDGQELEGDLKQATQRVSNIIERMTDAFVALDQDWRITCVNKITAEINNQKPEEIIGKTHWEQWPWSAGTIVEQNYRRAMAEQVAVHFEVVYEPLNIWLEIHAYPSPEGLEIYFRDISEAKSFEVNMQKNLNLYRTLSEAIPELVWSVLPNGTMDFANEKWHEYTGMSLKEVNQEGWIKIIHPDDVPRAEELWQRALETGTPQQLEFRFKDKNGNYRWFLGRNVPLKDEQKNVIKWLGTSIEIDEIKRTEAALIESETRLRLALEAADLGLWDYDIVSGRQTWSDRCKEMFGIERQNPELDFDDFINSIHPEDQDRVANTQKQAIANKSYYNTEYRITKPNGSLAWMISFGRAFYDGEGNACRMLGVVMDITERRSAEEWLQNQQKWLENVINSMPVPVLFVEPGTAKVTFANRTADELAGGEFPKEKPAEEYHNIYYCTDGQGNRIPDERMPGVRVARGEQLNGFEMDWHTPLGVRSLIVYGDMLPAMHGHPATGVLIFQDINQLKKIQEALRQNQQWLHTIVENASAGIYVKDIEGRYLLFNRKSEEIAKMSRDKILGKTDFEVFPREFAEGYVENDKKVIESGMPMEAEEVGEFDGKRTVLLSFKCPLYDANGVPYAICGISTNITERKETEKAIQESNNRLNLLFETARDLLSSNRPVALIESLFIKLQSMMDIDVLFNYLADEKGAGISLKSYFGISDAVAKGIEWLPLGEEICGTVAEERRQITVSNIGKLTDKKTDFLRLVGLSAYSCQPLIAGDKLLGTISFGSRTRNSFTPDEVALMQAVCDQIAVAMERANLLDYLHRQTEELTQANRMKDEFLAVVSHELRSPLNAILGWATMLRGRQLNESTKAKALETIERNAKSQKQLIEDLLDVSRIITGKLRLKVLPVQLPPIIEAVLDTVRPAAEAKTIAIESALDWQIGPVLGDADRLQQIIWNLLSNAIKFTPNGGRVDVLLQSFIEPMGSNIIAYAQIEVRDTGIGIEPEFLPYVFDRFRQADSSSTRSYGGLGLGLSIVRQLVEMHGGTVGVESLGKGEGTTFWVKLPLRENPPLKPENITEKSLNFGDEDSSLALQGVRILVVDDEPDTREVVKIFLESCGAVVKEAMSAQQALKILQEWQPDILLSDIGMPLENGYDLLSKVRALPLEKGGGVPAVALTAYASGDDQKRALDAGFQKHLPKPVNPIDLAAVVASLVGR
ncbi:PAS domain S-box protein [Ancylothrix sp. C2]|uniref:PAS domain S-box protein n=1 Tax=Ancylothrix sp. D3o TaxID=2953691 RepID=UPI0021BB38A7|nr:PAS domain S-box protein [Ancylothrix sp. D3o]MCT7950910.1 PAS domain S-box protein [Ancylothrix sp. D3o]